MPNLGVYDLNIRLYIVEKFIKNLVTGSESIVFDQPNRVLASASDNSTIFARINDNLIDDESISKLKINGLNADLANLESAIEAIINNNGDFPITVNEYIYNDEDSVWETVSRVISNVNAFYTFVFDTLPRIYSSTNAILNWIRGGVSAISGARDLGELVDTLDGLDETVNNPTTGLTKKVADNKLAQDAINDLTDAELLEQSTQIGDVLDDINEITVANELQDTLIDTATATAGSALAVGTAAGVTAAGAVATGSSNSAAIALLILALLGQGLLESDGSGGYQEPAMPPDYSGDILALQVTNTTQNTFLSGLVTAGYATLSSGIYTLTDDGANLLDRVNDAFDALVQCGILAKDNNGYGTGIPSYSLAPTMIDSTELTPLNVGSILDGFLHNGTRLFLYVITYLIPALQSAGMLIETIEFNQAVTPTYTPVTQSLLPNLVTAGLLNYDSGTHTYTLTTNGEQFMSWVTDLTASLVTSGIITETDTAGVLSYAYNPAFSPPGGSFASPVAPTIQRFLTGSGTYTLPTSPRAPLYIKVIMSGAGGGGGASYGFGNASSFAPNGTAGGSTTFGPNLTCNGGSGGNGADNNDSYASAPGGSYSVTSVSNQYVLFATNGSSGGGGLITAQTNANAIGGAGGTNPLGCGCPGAPFAAGGISALPNTGAGGSGAGPNSNQAFQFGGAGAGAGSYIEVIIGSPSSTYSYSVGSAGAGGASSGATSYSGGDGGSGIIIVEEYYPQLSESESVAVNELVVVNSALKDYGLFSADFVETTSPFNLKTALTNAHTQLNTSGLITSAALPAFTSTTLGTNLNTYMNLINNTLKGSGEWTADWTERSPLINVVTLNTFVNSISANVIAMRDSLGEADILTNGLYTTDSRAYNLSADVQNGGHVKYGGITFPPFLPNCIAWYNHQLSSYGSNQTAGLPATTPVSEWFPSFSNLTTGAQKWLASGQVTPVSPVINNSQSGYATSTYEIDTTNGGMLIQTINLNNTSDLFAFTVCMMFRPYTNGLGLTQCVFSNDTAGLSPNFLINASGNLYWFGGYSANVDQMYALQSGIINIGASNNLAKLTQNQYYFLCYTVGLATTSVNTYTWVGTTPTIFTTKNPNASRQTTCYLNNHLVGSCGFPASGQSTTGNCFGLGCQGNTSVNTNFPFKGSVVECSIYDSEFNLAQVSAHYDYLQAKYPSVTWGGLT